MRRVLALVPSVRTLAALSVLLGGACLGIAPAAVRAEPRPTVTGVERAAGGAPTDAAASAAAAGLAAAGGGTAAAAATRPRIGLALSGGGARGFAHVGVLRALEAMRIPVDCIAGTSAGSAVGAAYASGLSPDEIEAALRGADWERDIFDDAPPRRDQQPRRKNEEKAYLLDLTVGYRDGSVLMPPGLISGQKIELFLHRMLRSSTPLSSFDALPIPFRAIATDLEVGEMVVQDRGSLATAVRASMAVPSAFAPVQSDGRLLVDGGLTRNMPVDVVRSVCADVVIAVDIAGELLKRESLGNAFGVAGQMINILMERNMRDSRAEVRPGRDVMIKPDLGDLGSADFARGVDGIPAGERATLAARDELARLALPAEAYAAWQGERAGRVARDDRFRGVRVVGVEPRLGRSLLAQVGFPTSGELDRTKLDSTINRWNSSGDFDRIGYSLVPDGTGQVLQLEVIERGWGPNFLRFGLGAAADSNANGVFNVMFGYRRPGVNQWGGEFKSEFQFGSTARFSAELFQPFTDGDARFFATPQLLAEEVPLWVFNGRDRVAEYGLSTLQAGADVGLQGRYGEARLGVFGGQRDARRRTGSQLFPEVGSRYWGAQLSLLADQLDATDFPREGFLLGFTARGEDETDDTGRNEQVYRVQLEGKQVVSFGRHTFSLAARVGEASPTISVSQAFSLGGFMNLSGLQINQLIGTSVRYVSLNYQNQILTLSPPLGRGVYAGVALEAGRMLGQRLGLQTEAWTPGATAYLGAHTGIGPVYLGYGVASHGNRLVYLFLGRPGL